MADIPPTTMLEDCCAFVSRLWLESYTDGGAWVAHVSEGLDALLEGASDVTCAVVESIPEMPRWRVLHAHATRGIPALDEIALDLRRHEEGTRFRAEGLSAVGVLPLAGDEGLRSIVVRIDLQEESEWQHQVLGVLRALAMPLVENFVYRFLMRDVRRRELLALLSPAQRDLVPLLVDGLTEEQIGLRTDRSKHTVHDHAKRIYRAWSVSSRHELRQLWRGNHTS